MAFRFGRRRSAAADQEVLAQEIDVVERVSSHYRPGNRPNFGAPTRCPRCAEFGLVERVDMVGGRADNRCLRCGTCWTISVRALLAVGHPAEEPDRAELAKSGRAAARRTVKAQLEPTPDLPGVRFTRTDEGEVSRNEVHAATEPFPGVAELDEAVAASYRPLGRIGPMRVLLVEDNPDDVEIVKAILETAGPEVIDLRTATTLTAGEAAANGSDPDLVLLDLGLPDSRGLHTVEDWHQHVRPGPVLVVTGDLGREVMARGAELGVTGVVDKAELVTFLECGDAGTHAFLDRLTSAADRG